MGDEMVQRGSWCYEREDGAMARLTREAGPGELPGWRLVGAPYLVPAPPPDIPTAALTTEAPSPGFDDLAEPVPASREADDWMSA